MPDPKAPVDVPPDAAARLAIRTCLEETIIVEAAAGTGKTTELVERIVSVIAEGSTAVGEIVAVTFTEKAAGELKLRLRERLERARHELLHPAGASSQGVAYPTRTCPLIQSSGDNSGWGTRPPILAIEKALERLEEAYVSTIHGFCAELLRERPVEAQIDPRFEVLTDAEAERLYGHVFDLWLQEKLTDPPEGARRALRRTSRGSRDEAAGDQEGPTDRLKRAGWTLCQWRDFPTPWKRPVFDRPAVIDEMVRHVHDFADLTARARNKDRDGLYLGTWHVRSVSEATRAAEQVRRRDYDAIEAALVDLASDYDFKPGRVRKGYGSQYGDEVARADVVKQHEALVDALEKFRDLADADLSALLQTELIESIERYQAVKAEIGRLDFVDLLVRARNLVRDHPPARAAFQSRFRRIFVDEFQDTDPLQAEILLLLCADDPSVSAWRLVHPTRGKLFIVGDPKQSIYRFRRADVAIYEEVKELLQARGARVVYLMSSFRAVPSLQRFVNAAFRPVMTGRRDVLQPSYVPLAPCRTGTDEQPTVVALPVPRPYGVRAVTNAAIEASLPDAIGAFVQWLINESGWTVTERSTSSEAFRAAHRSVGESPLLGSKDASAHDSRAHHEPGTGNWGPAADPPRVRIQARHICILFRRFDSWGEDVTRAYVDALEARTLPHLLVGGKSFHAREEVETMRAALAAIERPDDELSVFATLRGSLFGITDEVLFEYRSGFGRLHPFRIPDELRHLSRVNRTVASGAPRTPRDERLCPIVEGLDLLRDLYRSRNYVPVNETIGRLLEKTRAHAGFVLRPSGEQALANALHIAELARHYEATGGISFRGFVEQLEEQAEAGDTSEAPIVEEGSDGVRIMTVHRAKGLEFPVVILADMTAKLARRTASRYIDLDRRLCAVRLAGWGPLDLLEQQPLEVARDESEGVRLAYVAATRARDLLIVPAVGDGPRSGTWLDPLNAAMYPPLERWPSPEPAPGCPAFGKDTVITRPEDVAMMATPVAPGLHRFEAPASTSEGPRDAPKTLGAKVVPFPPAPRSAGGDQAKESGEAGARDSGARDSDAHRERGTFSSARGAPPPLAAASPVAPQQPQALNVEPEPAPSPRPPAPGGQLQGEASSLAPSDISQSSQGPTPARGHVASSRSAAAAGARLAPGYSVVWWDPHVLDLDREPEVGVRQEELLGKDAPREVIERDLAAYHSWRAWRDRAVAQGSQPSLLVRTISEYAKTDRDTSTDRSTEVDLIDISTAGMRPGGIRFGTLVHAVLATVPFDADTSRVGDVTVLQGRILGATDEEVASAVSVVIGVLKHTILQRARTAAARGVCRREIPVTSREPDGTLLEGIVDLAFEEGGRWTVVDFKTDQELTGTLEVYRRQVQIYADIISKATGQPAAALLVRV